MDVAHGLGLLAVGLAVMLVIGIIGLKIINYKKREDKYGE